MEMLLGAGIILGTAVLIFAGIEIGGRWLDRIFGIARPDASNPLVLPHAQDRD